MQQGTFRFEVIGNNIYTLKNGRLKWAAHLNDVQQYFAYQSTFQIPIANTSSLYYNYFGRRELLQSSQSAELS